MDPSAQERWPEIERLLDQALDLAPEQRLAFLERTCSTDPELRAAVERLLQGTEAADSFLGEPAVAYAAPLVARVAGRQELAPGTPFGAYEVVRRLGRGGMATVYLAQDHKHHRAVAIKVLHPELAAAVGPERFLREIEIAAALHHPHILPLYDSGVNDGLLYYVMPYIEGESLRQRLAREEQLRIEDALRLVQEVASALDYAHRQGVVHRDIKPENILLQDGQAIVADFGIARAIDAAGGDRLAVTDRLGTTRSLDTVGGPRLTEPGPGVGTPAYMSPEQASSDAVIDGRADIYALSCVLYEMLAGQPPFTGRSRQQILARHAVDPVPSLHAVRQTASAGLEQVISRALAKVPADRYPTARAFAEALAGSPGDMMRSGTSWRRFAAVAGSTALLLALGGGVLWQRHQSASLSGSAATTARSNRLAVLPFENLGDSADAHFADGVTDAVRDKLAALPGLEVIAWTSSGQYRHTAKRPEQIGRELGVRYLLIGTVRWAKTPGRPSRVLVRPQLVDVQTGAERWGAPFEAALTDVFQVQAEVAARVAETLGLALGAGDLARLAERPTRNVAAYGLYLQGRAFWNQRTASALRNAVRYYELAIRQDSAYADAYAGLAEAYELFPDYGAGPPNEAHPKAKAAALRALSFDSALSQPHLVLADQRAFHDWEWRDADREYRRAIALNPSYATAHHWYADYLSIVGRMNEALVEIERARTLDPLSRSISTDQGMILYASRRYDEAIAQLRWTLDLDPDFAVARDWLGLAYLANGARTEAVAELETAVRLTGRQAYLGDLAYAYAVSGRRADALGIVRELAERSRHEYVSPHEFAVAYTGLGNRDQAFAWLERAGDARSAIVAVLPTEPLFDPLRSDPRFTRLLNRVGLR